jgi:DNA mismatch repair ATPase MutS
MMRSSSTQSWPKVAGHSGAIVDEPPIAIKEGGIFRDGYYAPLDELRNATRDGKNWIAQLQQREIEATGIKSLKVRYTSVFGYFIGRYVFHAHCSTQFSEACH